MVFNVQQKVVSYIYDVSMDGGTVGVHLSGALQTAGGQGLICQYKIVTPFVGAAGAMLSMGVTSDPTIYCKGAPIDPTAGPVGTWIDGGFPANTLLGEEIITTVTVNLFTAGKLVLYVIWIECSI